jgi:predicted ABC-type exoprotein transport system permease subunit
MKTLLYIYLFGAVLSQAVSYAWLFWGGMGVLLTILLFPIAVFVTSFGALINLGAVLPVVHLLILSFALMYDREK